MNDNQRMDTNRYKKYLLNNSSIHRSINKLNISNNSILETVSIYVLAPALGGFIHWLLFDAMKRNKNRLYFLARDGYLMYKAAIIFCKKLNIPIECRYLNCSRYSLRTPTFYINNKTALDYICRSSIELTLDKILKRSGITEKEHEQIIPKLDIKIKRNDPIPYYMLEEVRHNLETCELFLEYMNKTSKKLLPYLEGYLRQEGLTDEISYAIVDSGWIGSMQLSLYEVLTRMGKKENIEGYYWGLYDIPNKSKYKNYHCYYFSPRDGLHSKVNFNNCLFEAIYTAPHGMTTGYKYVNDKYVPIYGYISEKKKKFILSIEKYITDYINLFVNEIEFNSLKEIKANRNIIKKLMGEFMVNPSREEVDLFGNIKFSDDIIENEDQNIASNLSEEELKSNHVINKILRTCGIRKGYIKESAWYEGSAVKNGINVNKHLWQYKIYKYIRHIKKIYDFKRKNRGDE